MNGISKRSKLIIVMLCTIGGILILIGSTYAFFNYFRRGEVNNRFITGSLSIDFIDGEFITLTDQFPTSDAKARFIGDSTINPVNSGDITIASFIVKVTASDRLTYYVYGIFDSEDSDYSNSAFRFPDNQIKIYLETNNSETTNSTIYPNGGITTNVYTGTGTFDQVEWGEYGTLASGLLDSCALEDPNDDTSDIICTQTNDGGRIKLAEGYAEGGAEINHYYTMHMWISGNVTLSDVNPSADYCASYTSCMYTTGSSQKKIFSDMYYSLKIQVTADK